MVARCDPISLSVCLTEAIGLPRSNFTFWFDIRDLGAVFDHEEPLPHPACDQAQ